jgi:tetratricopeptide (TPR) repeat protein
VSSRPSPDRDREQRVPAIPAPELPEDLVGVQLDAQVRGDLRGLRKDVADEVAKHLVAAGTLLEADPERALAHARYARSKASRLAVVREAAGLAAYRAGEWNEAIGELRAARRMGGGPGHLAVLADAERALGRPEKALEVARGPEARELDRPDAIELLIVAAGARRDLGEVDAAVVSLQIPELDPSLIAPWSARLFYAYADLLLAAGRRDESIRWFLHAAQADDEELTDAADRLAELAEPESAGSEIAGSETVDPEIAGSEAAAGEPAGSVLADVVVAGNSAEPSGDPDR